ncbi:hypothetical protein OROGR_026418 [Orobanche gracilis]
MAVVLVVFFVSLSCFFFFGLCSFGTWFLIKTKKKKSERKIDIIHADEHFKAKEDIVKGPSGSEAVVLSVEADKHFEEEMIKNEKKREAGKVHAGGKSSSFLEMK